MPRLLAAATRTTAAVLVAFGATACTTHRPVEVPADLPPQPAGRTWAEVLAAPQPVTVTSWSTGQVKVPRSLLLDLTQPAAESLADEGVWVEVLAHAVRRANGDTYLIDTGLDHTFAERNRGNFGGLAVLAAPFIDIARQSAGTDIAARLRDAGGTLRGVFFTHLHVDHTAGVPDLPKDVPYVAGAGTLADSYESGLVVHVDHLRGLDTLRTLDFSAAPEMPPLGRALDLFGDGSLWAIATPGHSRGHVSYLVNAERGPVLLTGDASHTAWGFTHDVAPGKVVDAAAARASLAALRAFAARFPQVRVVYGHELP